MSTEPYVGLWVTADGRVRHRLLPAGRYTEARGTQEDAYQGRYHVHGDHIEYVDDTGFTADGDFVEDVLHHGGMVLYRTAETFTPGIVADIRAAQKADPHRPPLYAGARLLTGDPLIGTISQGDLLLSEGRIAGIGPGLSTAADDDNAIVIDCAGTTIVPGVVDLVAAAGLREYRSEHLGGLVPGEAATFIVLAGREHADTTEAWAAILAGTARVLAVVVAGVIVKWAGQRIVDMPAEAAIQGAVDPARVGTWIDETGFLHQHLLDTGRYDETRGGREHAFQGRYWISGDRIDYLDDLGFWAYGTFEDGVLHHAGYVLRPAATSVDESGAAR